MSLMAFLDTSKYGGRGNVRSDDWWVCYDNSKPGPQSCRIPLPDIMIRFLRNLGIHNIFRGTEFYAEETEDLLDHILLVEWGQTPGFLRPDHDTDSFTPIPLYPQGRDKARPYPTNPLRNQPSDIGRRHVPDFHSKAISFDLLCLEPDVEAPPLVPAGMYDGETFGEDPFDLPLEGFNPTLDSAVVLPTASPPPAPPGAAPKDELSYEPPVAQEDISPGKVTVEAESPVGDSMGGDITPSFSLLPFPASVTAAAAGIRNAWRTIVITASIDIATLLREAWS
ncbi:unnamed protein product [Agarophyton chilense]